MKKIVKKISIIFVVCLFSILGTYASGIAVKNNLKGKITVKVERITPNKKSSGQKLKVYPGKMKLFFDSHNDIEGTEYLVSIKGSTLISKTITRKYVVGKNKPGAITVNKEEKYGIKDIKIIPIYF